MKKLNVPPDALTKNKWVLIIGFLSITLIAPLIFKEYDSGVISLNALFGIIGSMITTALMWFGVSQIVFYLWRNFPWEKNPIKHLVIEILAILVYTALVVLLLILIGKFISSESNYDNLTLSIFFTLMVTFFMVSINEGHFFYMKWKETRILTEKLEKENLKSQYETLKSQINPHFLFNNLNTLASLIEENPKLAVNYVQLTADYYRSILNLRDKEVNTLEEELELIMNFYILQKNRYGENLKLVINIPDTIMNSMVAPLVLQMLLENAIKHNIISKDKPLTIEIFTENNQIVVRNNLQKRDQEQASNKFGLQNIIDRYSFLSDRNVEILENDSNFTVAIPILTM